MAIVAVLWTVALLSMIAVSFMSQSQGEVNLTRNLVENAKAEALADAGVYRAALALLEPDPRRQPRADGSAYRWSSAHGDVRISVQAEAGKIDLNVGADPMLVQLFVNEGLGQEAAQLLVAAVRDFTDEDHLVNGAGDGVGGEDDDYRAAGLKHDAKDRRFETVAELQQVLGMTGTLYERVAPALTVYSGNRSIDPMTAPPQALMALPGAGVAKVEALLAQRGGPPAAQPAVESSWPEADPFAAAAGIDPAVLDGGAPESQTYSGIGAYTVISIARTPGGGVFERQVVLRITGDIGEPFVIHEWRRAWADAAEDDTADGDADPVSDAEQDAVE